MAQGLGCDYPAPPIPPPPSSRLSCDGPFQTTTTLGLQARKKTQPVLLVTSLIGPHHFQFDFDLARLLMLSLQFDQERLLLRKLPLMLNHFALKSPQLILKCVSVHHLTTLLAPLSKSGPPPH